MYALITYNDKIMLHDIIAHNNDIQIYMYT